AIAKEYGRILGALATIYAVNAFITGEEVEWSPLSSDFGKIKIGNTRIDILAGVSQVTVLMSRVLSGEKKSLSGNVQAIRGDNVRYGGATTWSVISNFLRTKLTPGLGLGINLLEGKDLVGKKMDVSDIPKEVIVPLSFMDIYDAMEEEGIPMGMALGTLGLFGIGIQTHEEKGAKR
ncbi:MAG: hypothetical protein WCY59_08895, partial [Anaerovoracaceae bacterium]